MSKLDLGIRILQALADLGIKPNTFLGKASNVKKAFTGGKPTFFKPDVLETFRAQDGNFSDALKLMEDEAKYVVNATDAEKMAFLNNLSQYKSLGGPPKTKSGITALDQAKNLTKEAKNLQTSTEDLMSLAKKMKDEAEEGKKKALQDLDDFFTTGGQPLKAKNPKFLGGSMHEEGQIRTGVRQFLQKEYKQGRLKLDDLDKERIMEYSPMIEHDPILVFKKIYGEDAYNKAGSFPGAFEKGESFNHYEKIFRENMGDDILKVKDEKYKGDGPLVLTEREEVFKPTPDDDDMPFAEGGIAGFYTGGMVDVEPSLSDIGHGSDALMARTRLMSPGSQATTSTGLNYLLAEDNDNIRVPFSKGKLADAARRKFIKAASAGAAGLAALKTGLLGFGEKAAPVVEKVTENFSTTLSEAPGYFFDLATKIKMFGKKSKFGPQERMDEYYYTGKNGDQYTLTEDIATGDAQIVKDKMGVGSYNDKTFDTINDRTVLEYKAPKQDVDVETGKGTREAAEYEEYKVEFDTDGTEAGADAIDEIVQKEIIEEASEKITKKADGGRIGYSKGKAVLGFLELIKNPQKIKEAVENIFKTGDYKYDAEMAAESLVELNPKAFGNKLYEDLDEKTRMEIYSAVLPEVRTPIKSFAAEVENVKKVAPQMTERLELKAKYPGITDDLLDKILADDNPQRKAEVIATIDEAFKMMNKGKGPEEIIETFQNTTRTKQASGGLAKMLGE